MSTVVTFNRRTLVVAVAALLHVVLPWLTALGVLYLTMRAFGIPLDNEMLAPAVIVGVTCLFLIDLPQPLSVMRSTRTHLPIATGIIARWLGIQMVLLIIKAATHVLDPIPGLVFLVWGFGAPLAIIFVAEAVLKVRTLILIKSVEARTAVLAGYSDSSAALAKRLQSNPDLFLKFLGFFDDRSDVRLGMGTGEQRLGALADLPGYVKGQGVDVIFVALPIRNVKRVTDLLEELHDTTISIYYVPDIFVFDLIQTQATEIDGIPVIAMRETPFHGYSMIAKRTTDIVLSLALLLVFAPVLILAAILIKLSSPGPVIFKQRRYGLDGEEIYVYKLRTMTVMDNDGPVVQAKKNDARITSIGRILRRTSMDELPQFFNVLEGNMSLVGPRPHAVAHNEEYRRLIKGYMVRHKALPGITGLAQVSGCRGETARLEDMQRRVAFDLDYLRHWSLILDIRILLLTVVKVWRDDQAY